MHLRLTVGQFGLVLGGHFGSDVVAGPVAPLDEAEADQKGTKTGGGGYPHGDVCFCKIIPVLQSGQIFPPPGPPPLTTTAPLFCAVFVAKEESKSTRRKKQSW